MGTWDPRANEVFADALEVPPDRRSTFLQQACAGDGELLRQVEALLQAHADAASFLDQAFPPFPVPAGDTVTAAFLRDFYLGRGFELFEGAYSRWGRTYNSLTTLLSLGGTVAVDSAPIAADPAPKGESELDPVSMIGSVEFRRGSTVARLGRKHKLVRPKLTVAGQIDLWTMGRTMIGPPQAAASLLRSMR